MSTTALPAEPVICTIIAKNYLAQARVLTESFLAHHPGGRVYVLVVDGIEGSFDPAHERFITLDARALPFPSFEQMSFRYEVVELCTAVKPFLLEYLLARELLAPIFYFDPDICFYDRLTPLQSALDAADVVLTPHILEPLPDHNVEQELHILRAGVYNLGMIGLNHCPAVTALLRWWQARLVTLCLDDRPRGVFCDQRWADLIPVFCERVKLIRAPGCNVAYWNLHERRLRFTGSGWLVNDQPLIFFHFSGLVMDQPNTISRHFSSPRMAERPELLPLFDDYRRSALAAGYAECSRWKDGNSRFDNGVPIPPVAKLLWRDLSGETRWPRPFQSQGPDSYFAWLNCDVPEPRQTQPALTELARYIYEMRPELQKTFPDMCRSQRVAYLTWFVTDGAEKFALAPLFVEPIRARLAHLGLRSRSELARTVEALVKRRPLAALVEDGSPGPPNSRRRLYYAIRNPIRRLGLNGMLRRLLGPQLTNGIFRSMVRRPKRPASVRPARK